MLFASTRLTLTRELGSEHFRETLFVTDADELSARGFEKHDAHVKLDAPLTEEEQTLGAVKRAEAEAGSGTGVKEIHLSNHMKLPVEEDATAALKELGAGSGRVLVSLVWSYSSFVAGSASNSCRKSTPTPKSSSWSPPPNPRPPSPSLSRRYLPRSRASPSSATTTPTTARSRAPSSSSTRTLPSPARAPSGTGCCTP